MYVPLWKQHNQAVTSGLPCPCGCGLNHSTSTEVAA